MRPTEWHVKNADIKRDNWDALANGKSDFVVVNDLDYSCVCRFDKSMERACNDIAGMLLDALLSNAAYAGCRGLIDHAAHTRDANELIRITEALAEKGRLA